ncbi:hypothetical protein LMG24076_02820 [Trinickia soli]|nr:hypothetical protein LMG24076_02820 [Trinickia soli]
MTEFMCNKISEISLDDIVSEIDAPLWPVKNGGATSKRWIASWHRLEREFQLVFHK